MNGSGSGVRGAVDRHLALLHRLEQRGLRLRRRAVDLVGEQQVREDRSFAEAERPLGRRVDHLADHVGRHEVGGELHSLEVEVERGGDRLHEQGLGDAGHAFEQHVAPHEQRGDEPRQGAVLPDDDLATSDRTASTASRGLAPSSVTATSHAAGIMPAIRGSQCGPPRPRVPWRRVPRESSGPDPRARGRPSRDRRRCAATRGPRRRPRWRTG